MSRIKWNKSTLFLLLIKTTLKLVQLIWGFDVVLRMSDVFRFSPMW